MSIDVKALKRKFAEYPNILMYVELQAYLQNEKLLMVLARLNKRNIRSCIGPDCKSFEDLDRFCEVILLRIADIAQTDSD